MIAAFDASIGTTRRARIVAGAVVAALLAVALAVRPGPRRPSASDAAAAPALATQVVAAADADAFVRRVYDEGDPANYGAPNVTTLVVGSRSMGDFYLTWRGLVRFALPTLPAGATIESASLELRLLSADAQTAGPVTLEVCPASGTWDELAVNWNNQPAVGAPCATANVGMVADAWHAWDVTAIVAAWYGGAPNRGLRIRRANDEVAAQQRRDFAGRSHADASLRPRLVIAYRLDAPLTGRIRTPRGCLEDGQAPVYRPGEAFDATVRLDGGGATASVAVDLHGGPTGTTVLLDPIDAGTGRDLALSALRAAQGRGPITIGPDAVGRRTLSLKRASNGVPLGICSFDIVRPTDTPTPGPGPTPLPLAAPVDLACTPFSNPAGRFHGLAWRGEDAGATEIVVERAGSALPGRDAATLADVDGDGRDDLVVVERAAPAAVRVARSLGGGFQAPPAVWQPAVDPGDGPPALGDFDGDGRADLALIDRGDGTRILVGRSDGARFAAALASWLDAPSPGDARPLAGDVDGDGRDDLVLVGRVAGAQVWVARSMGDHFAAPAEWHASFAHPGEALALGDVDADGRADLVRFTCGTEGDVWVARSDGARFGAEARWHDTFCFGDETPGVGDLDRDGRADLVVVNHSTGDAYGAVSDGARFVGTAQRWGQGVVAQDADAAFGDADGDGRTDVVGLGRGGAEAVTVARSTGSALGARATWLDGLARLWWSEIARVARGAGLYADGPLALETGEARSYRVRAHAAAPPAERWSPYGNVAVCAAPTPAGARVVGLVRLERRTSNAGATVRIAAASTTTDASGAFALAGIPAGSHDLRISHPSYLAATFAVDVGSSPGAVVDLGTRLLLAGDVDQSAAIDAVDEARVTEALGASPGDGRWDAALDITDDGRVDLLDLVAIRYNRGRTGFLRR